MLITCRIDALLAQIDGTRGRMNLHLQRISRLMNQDCALKAAERKTAQKNCLIAEAALVVGAVGLTAIDFSTLGVVSVGAVAGVVLSANTVKTAQESLEEAKEDYAEAKC